MSEGFCPSCGQNWDSDEMLAKAVDLLRRCTSHAYDIRAESAKARQWLYQNFPTQKRSAEIKFCPSCDKDWTA